VNGGDLIDLSRRAVSAADPDEALRAVAQMRRELDEVEADAVAQAVGVGRSWARIADALGVSKQAAHKRHAGRLRKRRRRRRSRPRRLGRLRDGRAEIVVTAEARRAVRAAQIAALALRHAEVDPAHLLLGLLADGDGAASRALSSIGVEFDRARDAVARLELPKAWLNGPGLSASAAGQVPISAPARRALEGSLREAARLGHGHLGPEHLLLSLLREQGGATRALAELEIAPEDLERCLGKVLKEAEFARPG